ncbi:DNA-3-methyladenine glycosylase I [Pseudomonas sp. 8O]|uniref:DNA-3-methyladenine glycosylase I n=1 Tax=Pseudomonas sp. 8O TaxID=2653165 RepID=UPI0012F05245|nr:DNA-3-methyladenine glycosylase I [Pseudomonas sp. 8O]VXC23744.1 3-methyladenine DNA glycosylase [Pseudomonas sp. 8O]
MRDYKWLHEFCLNRFGSAKALEAMLPQPRSDAELRALSDDRYLSLISLRIFRAGLKHSLVDAKWPAFEEVFFGFDPEKVVLMGAERLENLMQDARLIRHLGKLKSVPRNAQFILDVRAGRLLGSPSSGAARHLDPQGCGECSTPAGDHMDGGGRKNAGSVFESGSCLPEGEGHQTGPAAHFSFGALIADWPVSDIVGLWKYLAKHGSQLGGLSAPRFLRMVGKDTFVPTDDMVAALKAQGVIDKAPTSLKDLAAVQAAFNQWQAESGRPLCQLSVMLAHTVNH